VELAEVLGVVRKMKVRAAAADDFVVAGIVIAYEGLF
jgi:hypothetical protein